MRGQGGERQKRKRGQGRKGVTEGELGKGWKRRQQREDKRMKRGKRKNIRGKERDRKGRRKWDDRVEAD